MWKISRGLVAAGLGAVACLPAGADAGHEGAIIVQKVKDVKDEGARRTTQYENLVQAGVIDPTKVVRSALQHAVSIASLLLTTEAVITQIPDENKNAAMPGGGMGAGMY